MTQAGAGRFLLFVTGVAALGGFLFGYDTAVISGAVGSLEAHFSLDDVQKGYAGASAILGCIPGAMLGGLLGDRYGRKRVLLLCAVLYLVSGVWSAVPRSFTEFLVARFIGGVGIGVSSMVCPVYIAEMAPGQVRGRLGTLFQLGIVVGIFLVFFVNREIQRQGDEAWNSAQGWRWMLASESLPALVFLVLLLPVPESPRWLLHAGRADEARRVLERIGGAEYARAEAEAIRDSVGMRQGSYAELLGPGVRRALAVGVVLSLCAQFSGINAIMYYAPEIFKAAGRSTDAAFASAVWVGAVNLLFTFVAVAWVDRLGRRPLLLAGTLVQTAALALVASLFAAGGQEGALLACILTFVAAFAMAMGPIPWLLNAEIFPTRVRGRAASVTTFAVWVSCFVVAQTFPVLDRRLGSAVTFAGYAAVSLLSFVFVLVYVPETKGKSLEEIEKTWRG
ncbi:MAG: sugar porter family MFS transporter [Gemmataceae bacterium]